MFASSITRFITDQPLLTLAASFMIATHGALQLYVTSKTRSKEQAATSWPQVTGTVQVSFVGTQHVATGSSSLSS